MMKTPQRVNNAEQAVDAVLQRVGKKILLGLPLGLGKSNLFANALFDRALADSSIDLQIFTALTLERPQPKSDLESRFLKPFTERVFGDYPELKYAKALHQGTLPGNIRVSEFFLLTGNWLSSPEAQQSYISANYTHVVRDLLAAGCNVIGQLIDRRTDAQGAERFSLSCNPELTLDVIDGMRAQEAKTGKAVAMVGEINETLPFMFNDAEVQADFFDVIFDPGRPYFQLFSLPHQSVDLVDYAAGFHAASLVQDGGTLQIGIGSLSDAIAHWLIVRHQQNDAYRNLLNSVATQTPQLTREQNPFAHGLYGASEMVVDPFLNLIETGIIKRKVYPDVELERALIAARERGETDTRVLEAGRNDGMIMHAGFFVGSREFYQKMKHMPDQTRHQIDMTRISFVNQLYGNKEELKRLQRQKARFINTAMMVTLNGAVISDGLEDGRVVSGVGGQYNFVAMGHELEGARSIIIVRSTRTAHGETNSNLLWSYAHCTIPRHLRDIVVSEYGIADLRGKSDAECIAALLNITDSRFQDELLKKAKHAKKVPQNYVIPNLWRNNTPERLLKEFRFATEHNLLPSFPFGSDFSDEEIRIGKALKWLQAHTATRTQTALLAAQALATPVDKKAFSPLFERMQLAQPKDAKEKFYQRLLGLALHKTQSA